MIRFALLLLTLLAHPALAQNADESLAQNVRQDVRAFLKHVLKKVDTLSEDELVRLFRCPPAGSPDEAGPPTPGEFLGRAVIHTRVEAIQVSTIRPSIPEAASSSVVIQPAKIGDSSDSTSFEEGSLLSVDPYAFEGLVKENKATPVLSMMVLQAVCRDSRAERLSQTEADALARALMQ